MRENREKKRADCSFNYVLVVAVAKPIQVRIYTNTFETQEEDEMLEGLHLRYRPLIDSELNYFACSYPML